MHRTERWKAGYFNQKEICDFLKITRTYWESQIAVGAIQRPTHRIGERCYYTTEEMAGIVNHFRARKKYDRREVDYSALEQFGLPGLPASVDVEGVHLGV